MQAIHQIMNYKSLLIDRGNWHRNSNDETEYKWNIDEIMFSNNLNCVLHLLGSRVLE